MKSWTVRGGAAASLLALAAWCSSCSKHEEPPIPPVARDTVTYVGTLAGFGGETGAFRILVIPQAGSTTAPSSARLTNPMIESTAYTDTARGTVRFAGAGAALPVTGFFSTDSTRLRLEATGFTAIATVSSGMLIGSYAHGGPAGTLVGITPPVPASGATVYCGTLDSASTFVASLGLIAYLPTATATTRNLSGAAWVAKDSSKFVVSGSTVNAPNAIWTWSFVGFQARDTIMTASPIQGDFTGPGSLKGTWSVVECPQQ